jgi:TPR repeat protein
MYDLGVEAHEQGDLPLAQMWLQRAAQAGHVDAYGALTQLASDRDDVEAEFRWSGLGAQAGQAFCQLRHGHMLMQTNPDDATVITGQAIPLLMQALNAGEAGALFYIGVGYAQIGDNANARVWLTRAEATGDPDATRVLDKYRLR